MDSITQYLHAIPAKILDEVLEGIAAELRVQRSKLWIDSLVDGRPTVFYIAQSGDTLSACAIDSRYFREAVANEVAKDAIALAKASAGLD